MNTNPNRSDSSWIERLARKMEKDIADSNARLSAAAPDLLEALKVALVSIERNTLQMGLDPAMDTECLYIRAVINKATIEEQTP
jgi:hypothetical protein